jgi:RHS repeat-associated protein
VAEIRYYPWGTERYTYGTTPTSYHFTGQRLESGIGLYYYGARWYDPYLNRWIQPDSIIPNPTNSQDLDRYSYARNNPVKYIDPNGHWLESVLDIAFIAIDIQQIVSEGWTPVNTAALAVDIVCLIIPFGTGGGPALRAATAGGEATLTIAQTAVRVPEILRVGQGTEKIIQLVEGSNSNGSESTDSDSSHQATTNSIGDPYPEIIDPRTNQPIPAPPDNLQLKPPNQRASWNLKDRTNFIRQWYEKGYSDPKGGWELYDIHHIIPREYGGTNDFYNLVPVLRDTHQQQLNAWWTHYR